MGDGKSQDALADALEMHKGGDPDGAAKLLAGTNIAEQLKVSSVSLGRTSEAEFMALPNSNEAQGELLQVVLLLKNACEIQISEMKAEEKGPNAVGKMRGQIEVLAKDLKDTTLMLQELGLALERSLNQ